jgi:ligand-binding sensor domain-containing protein/signal transduction histidine kinase
VKLIRVLAILVSLLVTEGLQGQQQALRFEQLSVDQGLSQASVRCLIQDRQGFLWIGTEDGLNRYDGHGFRIFRSDPNVAASLSSSYIHELLVDRGGDLWVGSKGGLDRYQPASESFIRYQVDSGSEGTLAYTVRSITEDIDGTVWVATNNHGLCRVERQQTRLICSHPCPELGQPSIYAVQSDHDGRLWLGTERDGVCRLDPDRDRAVYFRSHPETPSSLSTSCINTIYEDRSGRIWIGTEGGDTNLFRPESGDFIHYESSCEPARAGSDCVRAIFESIDGHIWIGSNGGGLDRLEPSTGAVYHFHTSAEPGPLSHDRVLSILQDRTGVMWVGTFGGGLNRLLRNRQEMAHFRMEPDNANSLSNNHVWAIHEDHDGDLWIGTSGGGLNHLDRQRMSFRHYRHDPDDRYSLASDSIMAIHEDRHGILWIGFFSSGLDRFERRTGRFRNFRHSSDDPTSLGADLVTAILDDRSGRLWVATDSGGLNLLDRDSGAFTRFQVDAGATSSLSDNAIWSLHEDRTGELWIGTWRGGLNRLDRERQRFSHYSNDPDDPTSISNDCVISIIEDSQGRLWVGTYGGFNRFHRDSETFTRYRRHHGLVNEVVYGILEDRQGWLWLSTNHGLSHFDPENTTFESYDVGDGLQSNEFNAGAYHRCTSGELAFGGINGFNLFIPRVPSSNPYPPQVVLTELQVFNQPVAIGEPVDGRVLLDSSIGVTSSIRLSYQDHVISFEYAGLHFVDADKNRYRYIMEGFDRKWNEVGGRRLATYTQLPPGRYTFKVDAASCDGVWSQEPATLQVTIVPPFWSTWWFRLSCAVALLALLGAAFEARNISVTHRNRELERRVADRTEQLEAANLELAEANKDLESFASSISHDLRRPLRKVDGFSWMLLSKYRELLDDEGQELLQRVRDSSQQMARLIDDLLFFAHTSRAEMYLNRVDLSSLAHEIAADLREAEPGRQVEWIIAPELEVIGDRRLLAIALENLLGNALKFTATMETARIELGVYEEAPQTAATEPGKAMVFFVRDNGVGFNMAWSGKIFEPFHRLHKDSRFPGTGIGLATVQRIVQRHGGMIWADGEEDQGATFYFTLPKPAPSAATIGLQLP